MSSRDDQGRRRSGRPLWLVEGLDIVEERRGPFLGVVFVVVLIPTVLAFVAPGVVPPTPLVGAAVGIAALLLGLAAALAVDTTDLIVRGPRHVGAAGGELVAILPSSVNSVSARRLAASVLEAREPGTQMLLGIASAGRETAETAAWTDAVAVELAKTGGVSVLRIDLASGRTDRPGLAEVVKGEIKLTSAVEFEPGLKLAHLGTGDDPIRALRALPSLPGRLPSDLDVLLVALPSATNREVVNATRALDHMLVMAHRDSTSRVGLIAALEALESTGTSPQVVLVDDRTVGRLGSVALGGPGATPEEVAAPDADPEAPALDVDVPATEGPGAEEELAAAGEIAEPADADVEEPVDDEAASAEDAAGPAHDGVDEPGDDARDDPEPLIRPSHVGGITGVAGGVVAAAQFGTLPTAEEASAPTPRGDADHIAPDGAAADADPTSGEPAEEFAATSAPDPAPSEPAAHDELPEWSRPWESEATTAAPDDELPEWSRPWESEATTAAPDDEPQSQLDLTGDDVSVAAPDLDLPPPDAATRVADEAPPGAEDAEAVDGAESAESAGASEPRGVDVLLGAAEAAALAMTEARDDAPMELPRIDAPTVDDRAATDPPPASAAPPAADLTPPSVGDADGAAEAHRYEPPPAADDGPLDRGVTGEAQPTDRIATSTEAGQRDGLPGEEDSTDELPAVRRPEPIRPAESAEDDLLRTTAQLAVLMDDLDVRATDEGPAAP